MASRNVHHQGKLQEPRNCLTQVLVWLMQRTESTFWRMSWVLIWILIFSTFGVKLTVSNVRGDIHFVKQEPLTSTFEGFLLMTMAFLKPQRKVPQSNFRELMINTSHSAIQTHFWRVFILMFSILDHCMLLPIPAFFHNLFIYRPPPSSPHFLRCPFNLIQ